MTEENNNNGNNNNPSSPSDLPVVSINFDRRLPVLHSYLGDLHQGELLFESLYEEPNTELKVPGYFFLFFGKYGEMRKMPTSSLSHFFSFCRTKKFF